MVGINKIISIIPISIGVNMNKIFSIFFLGKSYSLHPSMHKLERDKIEYCIELVNQGHYETILDAVIEEFDLQVK